jgi:hypothetical protein
MLLTAALKFEIEFNLRSIDRRLSPALVMIAATKPSTAINPAMISVVLMIVLNVLEKGGQKGTLPS